jgi:hypothetical protein
MDLYNDKLLAILDPNPEIARGLMDNVVALYKTRMIKQPGRKINVYTLFKQKSISRYKYDLVTGLVGGTPNLHELLRKDTKISSDAAVALYEETIAEARKRLPNLPHKEFIDMFKVIVELQGGGKKAEAPVTQINFDLANHLADRNLDVSDVIDEIKENEDGAKANG